GALAPTGLRAVRHWGGWRGPRAGIGRPREWPSAPRAGRHRVRGALRPDGTPGAGRGRRSGDRLPEDRVRAEHVPRPSRTQRGARVCVAVALRRFRRTDRPLWTDRPGGVDPARGPGAAAPRPHGPHLVSLTLSVR